MTNETELAKKMLSYFSYSDERRLPSFAKFAAATGHTVAALKSFCEKSEKFSQAYEECRARLYDMIAEGALMKKYDSSFAKFLLSGNLDDYGSCNDNGTPEEFKVNITVIEQGNGN